MPDPDPHPAAAHRQLGPALPGPLDLDDAAVFDTLDDQCRVCGCTDLDCSGCIARTGTACCWAEPGRCTACPPPQPASAAAGPVPVPRHVLLGWSRDVKTLALTAVLDSVDAEDLARDLAWWASCRADPQLAAALPPYAQTQVPPRVAAQVLHLFGTEPGDGYPPGGFVRALLEVMGRADPGNLARLAAAFPEHATAVHEAKYATGGLDRLRATAARDRRRSTDTGPGHVT